MCGSNAAQKGIEQQQQQQYTQLAANYNQQYGEHQGILNGLTAKLNPIIAAGPSQQGFSDAEMNTLNASSTNATAEGYGQAEQALQENQAAQGGGTTYLPSGGDEELRGKLAGTAVNELAGEKNQIQQAGFAQGNANYNNAVAGEENVAGLLNPEGQAGQTTSAGEAAGTTANQIAQQSNSVWGSVLGALGGVAGAATGVGGLASMFKSSAGSTLAKGVNAINSGNTAIQTMSPTYY